MISLFPSEPVKPGDSLPNAASDTHQNQQHHNRQLDYDAVARALTGGHEKKALIEKMKPLLAFIFKNQWNPETTGAHDEWDRSGLPADVLVLKKYAAGRKFDEFDLQRIDWRQRQIADLAAQYSRDDLNAVISVVEEMGQNREAYDELRVIIGNKAPAVFLNEVVQAHATAETAQKNVDGLLNGSGADRRPAHVQDVFLSHAQNLYRQMLDKSISMRDKQLLLNMWEEATDYHEQLTTGNPSDVDDDGWTVADLKLYVNLRGDFVDALKTVLDANQAERELGKSLWIRNKSDPPFEHIQAELKSMIEKSDAFERFVESIDLD